MYWIFTLGCIEEYPSLPNKQVVDKLDEDFDGDGYSEDDGDCDDNNALLSPATLEICDGIDNNCDGIIDEETAADTNTFLADFDEDGFGEIDSENYSCENALIGYVKYSIGDKFDCDPSDGNVFPGAARFESEICTADLDGDGYGDNRLSEPAQAGTDCDDSDINVYPGSAAFEDSRSCVLDTDGDGYGESNPPSFYDIGNDCNDENSAIFPDAPERCFDESGQIDTIDNNCNGEINESSAIDATQWYLDADEDGFGNATAQPIRSCEAPALYVINNVDCDDTLTSVNPVAPEYCDGIDNDCDDDIDEGSDTTAPLDAPIWYLDSDGDGFGDSENTIKICVPDSGYISDATDCNDNNPSRYPNAVEECNGADDDCDGITDENDSIDALLWYLDSDGDGFGDLNSTTSSCNQPEGYTNTSTDCDDENSEIKPGQFETCNNIDDNCNDDIDEDAIDPQIWYLDDDNDTFGDPSEFTYACTLPDGYVANSDDCDDMRSFVHPEADEICDGLDNNCNEQTDDDDEDISFASMNTYYADSDGDGFGNGGNIVFACTLPSDFVENSDDCDDDRMVINPLSNERCNNIDDDCDGDIDEDPVNPFTFYIDNDLDGFGVINDDVLISCPEEGGEAPDGYTRTAGDCNDNDNQINPSAAELCTVNVDENCDGQNIVGAIDPSFWFADTDGDGFGNEDYMVQVCGQPNGYVNNDEDCDDRDSDVTPNAIELCNGKLDNCSNTAEVIYDEIELRYVPLDEWDHDGDQYVECDLDVILDLWESQQDSILLGGSDCDDTRDYVHPTATEICNGQYDNCDNRIVLDGVVTNSPPLEFDDDGDGYVECEINPNIEWLGQESVKGGDCNDFRDDTHPEIIPDKPHLCVQDSDGDGQADCFFSSIVDEYTGCDFNITLGEDQGLDFVEISDLESSYEDYRLSNRFHISTTEVTNEFYFAVTGESPTAYLTCGEQCPITNLNWNQTAYFTNQLNDLLGLESCYDCTLTDENNSATATCTAKEDWEKFNYCNGYRLPTILEWFVAYRAGQRQNFWTADGGGSYVNNNCSAYINDSVSTPLSDYAHYLNCETNMPLPVASKLPNGFGIYDMIGNVMEPVTDQLYSNQTQTEYVNMIYSLEESTTRLYGGSFDKRPSDLGPDYENHGKTTTRYNQGIRVVRTVNTPPTVERVYFEGRPFDVNQDLQCFAEASDIDNDDIELTFQWYKNNVPYAGETLQTELTGDTIPKEELQYNDVWKCSVTASDSVLESEAAYNEIKIEGSLGNYTLLFNDDIESNFIRINENIDPRSLYGLLHNIYVMETEVTQEMYESLAGWNPSTFNSSSELGEAAAQAPVEEINYYQAMEVANLLSEREGLDSCYECSYSMNDKLSSIISCSEKEEYSLKAAFTCPGYRLPTDAEWRLAARSGSPYPMWTLLGGGYNGNNYAPGCIYNETLSDGSLIENYAKNVCWARQYDTWTTYNSKSLLPNDYGLYGFHGNVWEFVIDPNVEFEGGYLPYKSNFTDEPKIVLKGGAYDSTPHTLSADYIHNSWQKTSKGHQVGVRLIRSVLNSPPLPPSIRITQSESGGLHCSILKEGRDDYSTELSYHFEWKFNDNPIQEEHITQSVYQGDYIEETYIQTGEWKCSVRSHDGTQYSQMISSSLELEDQIQQYQVSFVKDGYMKMIRIPAGENVHETYTLTKDFYIAETELTMRQLFGILDLSLSYVNTHGSDHPANRISWHSAAFIANTLSDLEGREQCYSCSERTNPNNYTGTNSDIFQITCDEDPNFSDGDIYNCDGYRLPTEAEWEYAAYAGELTTYSGSNIFEEVSTRITGRSGTYSVYDKPPNAWGLYSMTGNVNEWCHDKEPSFFPSPSVDPIGTTGEQRAIRGGSRDYSAQYQVITYRRYWDPTTYTNWYWNDPQDIIGVRFARTAEEQ